MTLHCRTRSLADAVVDALAEEFDVRLDFGAVFRRCRGVRDSGLTPVLLVVGVAVVATELAGV